MRFTNPGPHVLDLCVVTLGEAEGVEPGVQEAADGVVAAVALGDLGAQPKALGGARSEQDGETGPFSRDLEQKCAGVLRLQIHVNLVKQI